ncbi:MAG: fatty acid desaturase [Sulfurimonas sp.]|jgi:fatty acid desaturase|uniref:fatty acid desaturase family protein n=1 Tax=Sulfurimonas sp. TaxID=2022749 RepID=UPI0039E506AC
MAETYTDYKDVDQKQLQKDIDAIKKTIGATTEEDFQHLLKLERWGRASTLSGFAFILLVIYLDYSAYPLHWIAFWGIGIMGSFLIGVGNVSRWSNVTHPILHGAYDKVPNIPKRYTKDGFASGNRRWIDWLDWIKPDAWAFEHNIMHHYHLGEADDPDNVEKNLEWLHEAKIPTWAKYAFVYIFAFTWKLTYYAPNTLRILENKARASKKEEPTLKYELTPFTKNGLELWKSYILPYGLFQFIFLPLLFFPFGGMEAVLSAFVLILIAEAFANLHSFLVIVPNHSAEDIYQFSTPHKTQGEYYLRQIMGSVNYNTGTDLIDFGQGFLNYQIEHHLFPNMPHSFYQKMQPIVKDICKKHNLEYRQESVFKRVLMTVDLMVGKTKLRTIEGI